tara:strand:- start:236 stop:940 length:705 start_codon:yes stop_codon:yes gene_type:complete
MKIAISQPTFLPYEGYFELINYVDKFIFLDSVQFDKRSWQQRNWFIIGKKEKLITIPVVTKNRFHQLLNEVEIDYTNFDIKNFFLSLELNYKKTKFFDLFYPKIHKIFNKKHKYLCDLNIDLIEQICKFFEIKTPLIKSSSYSIDKTFKNEKLLKKIVEKNNSREYISTIGSKDYFTNKNYLDDSKIKIRYFEYINSIFKSNNSKCKHLSILDTLFKDGKESKKRFKKNFKIMN